MIHDNGFRPFQVFVRHKNIKIFAMDSQNDEDDSDSDGNYSYSIPIKTIKNFIGYWNGFDTSDNALHGNSLLIHLAENKYMYIGSKIYTFTTQDEIIDYLSPVGNSDVPYPVAYGTKNIYIMH